MTNNNPSLNVPLGGSLPNNGTPAWGPRDTARLLVAGFIGGLATPMIQPVQEFLKSHRYPPDFGLGYWLLGAGLGVVGTVMVWLLKETDVKKALMLGLSLPAFFTSLGGAVQNSAGKVSAGTPIVFNASLAENAVGGLFSFFVGTANAQTAPSPSPEGRQLSIKVARIGAFSYRVEPLDAQGNVVSQPTEVKESEPLPTVLVLPGNVVALRFSAGDASWTQGLGTRPDHVVEVTLKGEGLRRKFDIAQALGKSPELTPEKLSAEIEVRP